MSEKIYCGSGKVFGQYGSINLGICLDDIPPEYIKRHTNGKSYLNLVLNQKREVDQYGKTHSIEVDTFEPQQQHGNGYNQQQATNYTNGGGVPLNQTNQPPQQPQGSIDQTDDIPF